MIVLLVVALLVAAVDVGRVLTFRNHAGARPTAAPFSPATLPSLVEAPPMTDPGTEPPTSIPANSTRVGLSAEPSGAGTSAPATASPVEPVAPAPLPVTCGTDLELADAPDAPYNFLCRQGDTPLTWPNDNISMYVSGLTPDQSAALSVALPQWEAQGRFNVTMVTSAAAANVTISSSDLKNTEDGRTFVHYVCAETCAFDHATIELSSTRALTNPLWTTTVLHELGHAAGLNHVSRSSQVMYPEIGLLSPTRYASGDTAGFQELARLRAS